MLTNLQKHWKKEYLFLLIAALCVLAYYYREQLSTNTFTEYLPIVGGLAFGLNTLVQIAK